MPLTSAEIDKLRRLEESLWRSETRYDLQHQERVFASDFIEFGRSGRIWARHECIVDGGAAIQAILPLPGFRIREIDRNTVLVTYRSEVRRERTESANRSSLWTRSDGGWQLRFHQGTPTG